MSTHFLTAGMIVFLLLLWAAIGHRITARYCCSLSILEACLEPCPSHRAAPRSKANLRCVVIRRLSFVGDGMTACGLGLAMGLGLLAATEFLGEETLHDMLTFNPGNFFT